MNYYYNPWVQTQPQYQQPQPQYQYQTQMQYQPQVLNGQMVDSIDAVKAKDVDMSGSPVYYPNVNGTEIYKKQLMADGTSKISTYVLKETDEKQSDLTSDMIDNLKNDIINAMKELIG